MAKKLTKAQINDINLQYLPRLTVNNAEAYLQKSAARSARLRKKIACQIDVPYGDTPGQTLDIFPATRKGAPVHVFIHGGYCGAPSTRTSTRTSPGRWWRPARPWCCPITISARRCA